MHDSSFVPVDLSDLETVDGGAAWWPTVGCLLMPWRDVVDGFACEGVR